MDTNPSATPTFPGWQSARPGQRVRSNRTGREGTLVRSVVVGIGSSYARVVWDASDDSPSVNDIVVAPAVELTPLT